MVRLEFVGEFRKPFLRKLNTFSLKYPLECLKHSFEKSLYKTESGAITDPTFLACGGSKLPKTPILDSASF